jgi:hypothetical protein
VFRIKVKAIIEWAKGARNGMCVFLCSGELYIIENTWERAVKREEWIGVKPDPGVDGLGFDLDYQGDYIYKSRVSLLYFFQSLGGSEMQS